MLSHTSAALGTRAVKMWKAEKERERLEMGRTEAVWELQEGFGNMKPGMCSSAAASERTTPARSWILPKFKGGLLCQVAGFVPPLAESSLHFLTSGR